MDIGLWLNRYCPATDIKEVNSSDAVSLISFVERYAPHVACLVETHVDDGCDLVVFDFQTSRPQRSVHAISQCERIGIHFGSDDTMPIVYMLRDDFPDTDHQLLTTEGSPKAICIDDRLWAEARLTWTPAELIQRILSWFSRAASGELHDARQPIDPILSVSPLSFIIPRAALDDGNDADLIGVHNEQHRRTLQVKPVKQISELHDQHEPICVMAYRVTPQRMTRMHFAPDNLGSLADMLSHRGIDLFDDLTKRLSMWLEEGHKAAWRLSSRFAIIVEMPILSSSQEHQEGTDLRAYMTNKIGGDIAVALGTALKSAQKDEGSTVGFVKTLVPTRIDIEAVRDIKVQVAEVHYEFDRKLATQLTDRNDEDTRDVVIVGAGAIGSHIADCLIREGLFSWTVIDNDYLLPHNIGRHIGRMTDVTKYKAQLLADVFSETLTTESPIVHPIVANVLSDAPSRDEIDIALNNADFIIDASASILVARFLSDHASTGRRISLFFNPSGDAGILLVEPTDRMCTLRDLEAQYLGLISMHEQLSNHLLKSEKTFAYTGACRAITNLIPQSQILTLSGLIASGLKKTIAQDEGAIKIWSLDENGAVDFCEFNPTAITSFHAADWTIVVDQRVIQSIMKLRCDSLPNETGGILFGVVDIPAKYIHLVGATAAPVDSKENLSEFVRGTAGVQENIDNVFERTKGQVRYVGEWHSHPRHTATIPSTTDITQIDWLATLFDMDTLPALMLIAGDSEVNVILANQQAKPMNDALTERARSEQCQIV